MAIAQSSKRSLIFKKESSWGVAAGDTGGQVIRRVQSTLGLTKPNYQSQEKRQDFQRADSRHGIRRIQGGINGELYLGAWELFLAALCRRDFTATTQIAAESGDGFTYVSSTGVLTRAGGSGGSFITEGVRVGMVVRPADLHASLDNRNFLVTAVTTLTLTWVPIDGGTLGSDVSVADENATLTIPGKSTFIPTTGHTSDSFTIEDYESALDISERYDGVVIGGAQLQVPASGIATIDFNNMLGKDVTLESAGNAPYFTSPTAAGVQRALASTPGYMRMNGGVVAVATSISLTIDLGIEAPDVAFAETTPAVLYGPAAMISGQASIFVTDQSYLQAFKDEAEMEMNLILQAPGNQPRGFLNICMNRVKINSATRDDPERGITQTIDFESLLKETATGYESTSLFIQDSSLV
jgi:hypothetical protein